jgi:hypothetical protein
LSYQIVLCNISDNWIAFVNSQGTGFTLNELNEELFCWTLIRQLDSQKYQDLRLTLIKDKALTKNSAISMATTIESGLLAVQPSDTAFYARSPGPSTAPAPVSSSCKWCLGKGRTDQAKTHTLEQCTGLEASIEHFKSNKRTVAKSKPKQSANAVTEFAGEASSFNSLTSDPADHFWIPDSGATSNMTSHKEWIVDYIPLRLPIHLGNNSVYSAGVGKV